ncbi:hypothetical protein [Mycoplasma suis]|uniref:Uncharacterized protein n=1 Tax=Mycoplasma suis (strain Illinois) TaxID=768700 RepID=F0QRS7_MYCSL|nr:hypothetical protein [Mycoplasma suis]ADX98197.1 hypothetical protein MSU_0666 [Mycoplasma suis str. Illinois]
MRALKAITISIISLASLGGGFELNRLLTDNYLEENDVEWESVWILGEGQQNICSISHRKEGVKNNIDERGQITRNCFTSWAQNLKKNKESSKAEWIVRARSEDSVLGILGTETFYEDFFNKRRGDSSVSDNSNDDSEKITLQVLKEKCDYKEKTDKDSWINIKCSKPQATT